MYDDGIDFCDRQVQAAERGKCQDLGEANMEPNTHILVYKGCMNLKD